MDLAVRLPLSIEERETTRTLTAWRTGVSLYIDTIHTVFCLFSPKKKELQ